MLCNSEVEGSCEFRNIVAHSPTILHNIREGRILEIKLVVYTFSAMKIVNFNGLVQTKHGSTFFLK
jgi:hypothetical protein